MKKKFNIKMINFENSHYTMTFLTIFVGLFMAFLLHMIMDFIYSSGYNFILLTLNMPLILLFSGFYSISTSIIITFVIFALEKFIMMLNRD